MQNLHENSEARVIGLFESKSAFFKGEDHSSIIDFWTLKPKKPKQDEQMLEEANIIGTFGEQHKFLFG
jgi:hypothetical protein